MSDIKNYYSNQKYDRFETDYRILDAIENITGSDITDQESQAYVWWTNGGNETQIIEYLDVNFPDWTEVAPLYWGDGGINADKTAY